MSDFPQSNILFDNEISQAEAMPHVEAWLASSRQLPGADNRILTPIMDGTIVPTRADCIVDTEGGAPADDLLTISTASLHTGAEIRLYAADQGRVVTVKHQPGVVNGITLVGGRDGTLEPNAYMHLKRNGEYWIEIMGAASSNSYSPDNPPPLATPTTPGIVKPDNVTTEVDPVTGIISAKGGARLLSLDYSTTGALAPGYLFLGIDNGILTKAAFPDAYAQLVQDLANGATGILTSEVAWQAEKAANGGKCGKFMLDVSNETFRVPYVPELFFRDGPAGGYHIDTMRPITGSAATEPSLGLLAANASVAGALKKGDVNRSYMPGVQSYPGRDLVLDTELLGPHFSGTETQPENASYPVMIKMYGSVTNAGSADIAALVQLVTGKVDTAELNRRVGSVTIYPGGTEANPGTIGQSQRIVVDNPIGNAKNCIVVAEVLFNGSWGQTGFVFGTTSSGIFASCFNDTQIVINTGAGRIVLESWYGGNPWNGAYSGTSEALPFRVKIFLVGN